MYLVIITLVLVFSRNINPRPYFETESFGSRPDNGGGLILRKIVMIRFSHNYYSNHQIFINCVKLYTYNKQHSQRKKEIKLCILQFEDKIFAHISSTAGFPANIPSGSSRTKSVAGSVLEQKARSGFRTQF